MSVAVFPGSFNPVHRGHVEVLEQATKLFDQVVLLQLQNPDKPEPKSLANQGLISGITIPPGVILQVYSGWLKDYILAWDEFERPKWVEDPGPIAAVVRGIRNGKDLDEAMTYQECNRDLGVQIPFVHIITSPQVAHLSSSYVRELDRKGIQHILGETYTRIRRESRR